MLDVIGLHHVTLLVRDLERARVFYEDSLGLTPIPRPSFPFPGAWYGLGEESLHLIVDPSQVPSKRQVLTSRSAHVAIRVRSFSQALFWLAERGFSPDSPDPERKILVIRDSIAGFPQIFLQDPDGNILELNAEKVDEPGSISRGS